MKVANSVESKKAYALVCDLQSYFATKLQEVFSLNQDAFVPVSWLRDEGEHGGGTRIVAQADNCFNRGSINVSQVHYEDLPEKKLASATALSTIIHPKHPQLPSIHMHISWTEMKDGPGYWRVMADLNPSHPNEADRDTFLDSLQHFGGEYFNHGQKQGDQYFYIPALQRHRGVAHFYLEGHRTEDLEADRTYADQFGKGMIDCYCNILAKNSAD